MTAVMLLQTDDAPRMLRGEPAEGGVLVVPGAEATAHWLDLPEGSSAQRRSAAAFILEREMATGPLALHLAIGRAEEGGRTLVVAVEHSRLQAWLDVAGAAGFVPSTVVPDHLMLAPAEDGALVAAPFGERLALRGDGLALSAEPDLALAVAGERPIQRLSEAERDASLLRLAADPPVNLLQPGFRRRLETPRRSPLVTAALAALLIASPLLVIGVRAARLDLESRRLNGETRAAAERLAPGSGADAAQIIGARDPQSRVTTVTARLLSAMEAVPQAELYALAFGPDRVLRASVAHGGPDDLGRLRRGLAGQGFAVTEAPAPAWNGRPAVVLTLAPAS